VHETYANKGRPSIDPVVFFQLQLVMFFEGIRSERQLMRHAADRLSVLWYLGYNVEPPCASKPTSMPSASNATAQMRPPAMPAPSNPIAPVVRTDASSHVALTSLLWIESERTMRLKPTKRRCASARSGWNHCLRRVKTGMACAVFACGSTGRVNCEALIRAAGQNLKRLLKKGGWGRRPFPAETLYAPLFDCSRVVYVSFFGIYVYFLDNLLSIPDGWEEGHHIPLMSFGEIFSTRCVGIRTKFSEMSILGNAPKRQNKRIMLSYR
jgi:hypothetical protein